MPVDYPPQPAGSVIGLHEAADERLVLDIPPGKKSGGLGCFAVMWNGFMTLFTGVFLFAWDKNQANMPQGPWLPLLFVGVFWAVGFGLIYAWLKMRYERCFLFIEPDRAVLRKMFLGRQSQTELPLDESSRAQLTEAYSQNDVPVYRVTVTGVGGNVIHFGTSLDQTEKDWCVDAVNALLQPPPPTTSVTRTTARPPTACEACGADIPRDAFRTEDGLAICPSCEHVQAQRPVAAASESADSEPETDTALPDELPGVVTILEDSSDRLGLQLNVTESTQARWVVGLLAGGFALMWYAVTCGTFLMNLFAQPAAAFDWCGLLFLLPFLLGGSMPLGIAFLAVCGRLTTWIDLEIVKIRLHVGPFGKTWVMNTADITAVRLIDSSEMASQVGNPRIASRNPRVQGNQQFSKAAGICAGTRILSMTGLHQPLTARFVVRKVKIWLREHARNSQI